jgi:hypothetical protein
MVAMTYELGGYCFDILGLFPTLIDGILDI